MAVSMHWKLTVAAAAAAALTVAACGDDSKGGDDKDSGTQDGGSKPDATVMGGNDASLSLPIADLDDGVSGKPCMADNECAGTNGYCLLGVCSGACQNDGNCGAGGTCTKPVSGGDGACVKICMGNADCVQGQDCREGIELGAIFEGIAGAVADAGIALDAGNVQVSNLPKTCGPSLGTVDLPDGVVGKACTMHTQCTPGECLSDINIFEEFPSGYCSGKCISDGQCGKGAVCYKNPLAALTKTDGRCLLTCTTQAECPSSLTCRTSDALLDPKKYCLSTPPVRPDAGTTQDAGSTTDAGATADAGTADGG